MPQDGPLAQPPRFSINQIPSGLLDRLKDWGVTGGLIALVGLFCWMTIGRESAKNAQEAHTRSMDLMRLTHESVLATRDFEITRLSARVKDLEDRALLLQEQLSRCAVKAQEDLERMVPDLVKLKDESEKAKPTMKSRTEPK